MFWETVYGCVLHGGEAADPCDPGVQEISAFSVTRDADSRKMNFTATIRTRFGDTSIVSVSSRPSFIFARVSYHGHFREHGHYRGQKHALHQQTLDHHCTQPAI